MAWTSPRTWAAAEKLTASLTNAQLRDNLAFLHMGQVCSIYQTVQQTGIATASPVKITMDATEVDTGSLADLANDEIDIGVTGLYLLVGVVSFTANATGYRRAQIALDGTAISPANATDANAASGLATNPVAFTIRSLTAGQAVSLQGLHTVGSNHTTNVTLPYRSQLWVARVGAL
jgi:hypothetical protein